MLRLPRCLVALVVLLLMALPLGADVGAGVSAGSGGGVVAGGLGSGGSSEDIIPPRGSTEIQQRDPTLGQGDTEDSLEIFVRGSLTVSQDRKIERYGEAFFRNPPSTFAPGNEIPVGPEYIVGPGDSFRINVWGMVQGSWSVTVDRSGLVSIPTVGTFPVAGLTLDNSRRPWVGRLDDSIRVLKSAFPWGS